MTVEVMKGGTKMKTVAKIGKTAGKVVLALLGGVFMPVLIWVALGVAVTHGTAKKGAPRAKATTTGQPLAA